MLACTKLLNRGTWEILNTPIVVKVYKEPEYILKVFRKSDRVIVLKKRSNVCGGKDAATYVYSKQKEPPAAEQDNVQNKA
jgi:hypothetical protein